MSWLTSTLILAAIGVIAFCVITFRKTRSSSMKRESEYESLFKKNNVAMLLIDPETTDIVDANAAACSFYGFSRETLIGRKLIDFSILPDRRGHREALNTMQEQSRRRTNRHRLANGELRDVEVYNSPISVGGKMLEYSIVLDITDRKQTEDKLHATMSQLAALIDNMREGILFEDRSRRIVLANQAFCSLFNLPMTPLALIGTDSRTAVRDASIAFADPQLFVTRIDEIIAGGNIITNEKISLSDNRAFERDYVPIFIRGTYLGHLWQYRDVTEQQRLQDQLRHSQKMEAIGAVAGGIAHDFNNILTAIIGYANLLKLGGRLRPSDGSHVDQILVSAERASGLTHSLLAFSSNQNVSLRPVNLNNIIQRIAQLLHRVIGEDIDLSARPLAEPAIIMGDSGQLEQVLMILAANARDAMPDGGHFSIVVSLVELDEAFVRLHGYGKNGSYAQISVSDTGTGIDPKMRERIFEPFFSTKDGGKGTGLGLAIVYGIVKQHNGYINCYSEPGKGTTFKIYLPLTRAEQPAEQLTDPPVLPGGNEVVLVAEDDIEVQRLTQAVLQEFGYTVIVAEDGETAERKFLENRDRIKLLIIDVIMPKRGGKEAYDAIKKINPDIKTLFTSGYSLDIIQKRGILESGVPFISKPISPKELLLKVREVLDQ